MAEDLSQLVEADPKRPVTDRELAACTAQELQQSQKLEAIARENDYKGFTASVLKENAAMLRVFKRCYPDAKITLSGGSDLSVVMDFK